MAKYKSSPAEIAPRGYVSVREDGLVQIETAKIPTPQNSYDSDFCWAIPRLDAVSFFFAKERLGTPSGLRSRLELRFPIESFVQNFIGGSEEFRQKLRAKMPRSYEAPASSLVEGWCTTAAEKEHSEWVNLDLLAYSGSQASLDFFHLPPAATAQFGKTKNPSLMQVSPVVRVLTTATELCRLLAMCETISAELPSIGESGRIEP